MYIFNEMSYWLILGSFLLADMQSVQKESLSSKGKEEKHAGTIQG